MIHEVLTHPVATFFVLVGIAIVLSEFRPLSRCNCSHQEDK